MQPPSWHTFWEVFWLLAIWVPIALLWAAALYDLITHAGISGKGKALWTLLIVFVPIFGALIYFALRPKRPMPEDDKTIEAQRTTASIVDALEHAGRLHDAGQLSTAEYERVKGQLMAGLPDGGAAGRP
jgi:Phospholipase_D-nuclease N-terminal